MENLNRQGETLTPETQFETMRHAQECMACTTAQPLAIPDQRQVEPQETEPLLPTADLETTTIQEYRITALVLAGLVEALDDRRPLRQLEPHLTPLLYWHLNERERKPDELQQGFRLRTLHTQKPQPEVIEASGTASNHRVARAVAARFHHYRRGWQCVTVKILC
ncbi:Rv3235 family protein [Amycolatopsis sp. NPDC051061]|uniref:Rv3235 family protein n=1 Tax=Amycolatopsis sp. NPDC051061 TaxID=3155042 RepID=UPI00342E8B19